MYRPALIIASLLLLIPLIGTTPANAQEYSERFAVGFGAFVPDGPATLGTLVSFNYGGRVSEQLRIGAELSWYRRTHDSTYLFVDDPATASGVMVDTVATTHIFPLMGTADYYFPTGSNGREFYFGLGAGVDFLRTKHFPRSSAPDLSRSASGLAYMARVGISTRPGRTVGAIYVEAFYKGSSIKEEDELVADRAADTETRSGGFGARIGYRF